MKIDGITIEVVRNALQSVAEEMGNTLIRTAFSTNIKDRLDASAAVYTPKGELVAQAEHIPLHLGLMPSVVKEVLHIYPPETLESGDAILINDPYISGSHLPDVFLVTPVFYGGKIVAITSNIAHHVDVGGIAPGSMSVNATDIFQEGLRLPGVKFIKQGEMDESLLRVIQTNVRTSSVTTGDLYAQIAANNVGAKRVIELVETYGEDYFQACLEAILDYSERRMKKALEKIPAGVYKFTDYLEGDGLNEWDIPIKVAIKVEKDNVYLDFEGSSKQTKGPVNSTIGVTRACAYYGIKAMCDPDVPTNAGAFRVIHVKAPEGSIVNPTFPAPVSNANINTAQRVADTILGALADVLPKRAMAACSGTMNNFTIGGFDHQTKEYFSYVETYGGGQGAMHDLDGMDGVHTNMTNTLNTPTEVMEHTYPFRVERYGFAEGTGGAGKKRGGMGLIREIVIEADDVTISLSTERHHRAPWGLFGGKSGGKSECILIEPDGTEHLLPSKSTLTVQKGTHIILKTSGGGGYGPPKERKKQEVQRDIVNGTITEEEAKQQYGYFPNHLEK